MAKQNIQSWRLDALQQTWVFASAGGIPECIYWGDALPLDEDLAYLYTNQQPPITGATLDHAIPLSLCPEVSRGFMGQPGLVLSTVAGERVLPHFHCHEVKQTEHALTFVCQDQSLGLQLQLYIELDQASGVLKAETSLSQSIVQATPQVSTLRIDWLSAPVFPVPGVANGWLDFAGRWCGEFQPQSSPWQFGVHQRHSHEGRTGHGHVPLFFCGEYPLRSTQGATYGWHLGWSGGHSMVAEELNDGRRQVQFAALQQTTLLDDPQVTVKSPPLYLSYAADGLNGVMRHFHAYSRAHLINFPMPHKPRPVHYNCWEAVYFEHDLTTLKAIASEAAALGAERFVLDDGWFKGRDHDRAALGDWQVDSTKYPEGLQPLIDHIHAEGMGFGLWVEPEMVNPDSDLYRAHPEWVLGPAHHPTGRQQWVLDLRQSAVMDYLTESLGNLLHMYPIEYLKWDHNRQLLGADSAQTKAYYTLLKTLRRAYPQVEIESCASGGGRIDYGVLPYVQRFWLSDSNDALERWRIQHEAALLLPAEVTGSHVGPRHCHTSGRVLPMAFRAWVAASRHLGFEMDPRELDDEERQVLQAITQWWKDNRAWLCCGQVLRLDSDDEAVLAEMTLSADAQRFVLMAAQMQTSARNSTRLLRLTGLQPQQYYRLILRNPEQIAPNLTRFWSSPLQDEQGLVLSGQTLMKQGISLPVAFPATMWVIEAEAIMRSPQ